MRETSSKHLATAACIALALATACRGDAVHVHDHEQETTHWGYEGDEGQPLNDRELVLISRDRSEREETSP